MSSNMRFTDRKKEPVQVRLTNYAYANITSNVNREISFDDVEISKSREQFVNEEDVLSSIKCKLRFEHDKVLREISGDQHDSLPNGEGGMTVEYLVNMEVQSEEVSFDHKADRAAKISSSYLRDKQKEKRKITAQISRLKKKADRITQDLTRASKGSKMEHQADLSAFATEMSGYASNMSSWFMRKLVDPKSVGILLATLGYIETAYQAWDRKEIVFRIVLLYMERLYSECAPEGTFTTWADFLVRELCDLKDAARNSFGHLEDQAGFSNFVDKSKVVLGSDSLNYFKKVISLLVSIGFMSRVSTIYGVRMFTERAVDKCSSLEDVFTISVTCIDYFVKAGRKFLESSDWMDLLYEDSMSTIMGRMSKIMEFKQNMLTDMVDLEEYNRFAIETRDFLKCKAKSENVVGQSAILRHISVVEEFMRDIRTRRTGFVPKPAPVAININGGSSLGKSSLCHFVCTCAAKALGSESFIGSTASINGSTKHDDSMNSGVRCILEDDVNYPKQEVVDGIQGSMVMDVVNNNVKFCAKADLDGKGTVMKKCEFYCSTCNNENMFIRSFNMPEALFRRVFSLEVKLLPDAQTTSGELDSSFAIKMMAPGPDGVPTRIPSEIWSLSLKKYDFRTHSYNSLYFGEKPYKLSQDPIVGGVKLEDVSLPLILVAIRHLVMDNAKTQEKVVNFLSKPIPSCPHSNFVQLCSECNPNYTALPVPKATVVQNVQQPTVAVRKPALTIDTSIGGISPMSFSSADSSPKSPPGVRFASPVVSNSPSADVLDAYYASAACEDQAGVCDSMKHLAAELKAKGVGVVEKVTSTNCKDYVHPGKAIRNCSSALYDMIPSWMAFSLVSKTYKVWAPVLRLYFRYNAADKISVFRFKVLYLQIYAVVFAGLLPWVWLLAQSGACYYSLLFLISLLAYFSVCLIKNSIQYVFSAEVIRVNKTQWRMFMAGTVDAAYSWRYWVLGCFTSLLLAGLMLKRSFASSMDQQAYEVPYEATCNWSGKEAPVQPGAEIVTSTVEQLVNKLALHSAVIVGVTDKGSLTCRACPYKNGTWITNVHFLEAIENKPISLHSAGYVRQLRISRRDWRVIRGDIALLMVSCPTQPDFSGYITKDIPSGQFPAQWLFKEMDGSTKVVDVRAGFVPPSGWGIIPGNLDPIIRVDLGFPSQKGMCGAVLLSVSPRTISIVGIHRAGFTGTPDVAIGAFNAFDVKQAFDKFSDRHMVPHIGGLELFGKEIPLGDNVPLKSCVNHLYDDDEDYTDRVMVLGSVDVGDKTEKLHGNTHKSPIFNAMELEFGEPDTGPCKYNQPEWLSSQPAIMNTTVSHLYEIPAFECAMTALTRYYMEAVDAGVYRGIEPFTIEEACQGIDGRPYVNGLNYHSSMGLPYNETKMKHSFVLDNGKRMLDPDIVEDVKYLLDKLSDDKLAVSLFAELKYKDEATKLVEGYDGRRVPKTARVYACYPVAVQVIMAMVFGPFGEAQNYNPKEVGACVGYDMCSHDAKAVIDEASAFGTDEIIDGDYAHFDQSSTPEVTDRTMSIDLMIAERIGYPKWAITVMRNIIILLTFPVVIVNGVAIVVSGMTTSGHGYTIHANNKICKFYLAYSFYQKILREKPVLPKVDNVEVEACGRVYNVPYFFCISKFVTQGDDHIGSVRKEFRPYLNMQTIQQELAVVDLAYTDASKSVVNKESDPMFSVLGRSLENLFEEVGAEFLKRRFVPIVVEIDGRKVSTIASPIAMRSILKSLYWKKSFELDHVWLEQVCHGAAREVFFYGEEVFDSFIAKLDKVLQEAGVCTFTSEIASFEVHMQKYVKTLSRSNSVRDCERTRFRNRIVLLGNSRMEFAPHLRDTAKYLFCVDGFDVGSVAEFKWNDKFDVYPRLGIHSASLFRDDDERILQKSGSVVLVRHDEELDKIYLDSFPDITAEVKSSLYRVGSSKYLPPPRGR